MANTLTYRNSFNKSHNVNVMLGQEINHAQNDNTFMSAKLFPVSVTAEAALENFALGTPNQSTSYKVLPTEPLLSSDVHCMITKIVIMLL